MDPKDLRTKSIIELTRKIYNCASCQQLIVGDYYVVANCSYHEACFNCHRCGDNMPRVNLKCENSIFISISLILRFYILQGYHNMNGLFCCPKCYSTMLPNCASCRKPIESSSCIKAEDQNWHFNCFACTECKQPFRDGRYFMIGKQQFCFEHQWSRREMPYKTKSQS